MAEGEGQSQNLRLTEQVDHVLSTIEELLRTILDLSQLEAGVIKPSIQTIALDDLFRSLTVDLEPFARSRHLSLTCRPTTACVISDPLMLRRILQNLLSNAVRYTERGGVKLAARRRGDRMRIEVWDTGPGIAPSERNRIFEEFQRGSASERATGGGFGLGLSIVQRTAEALGHNIELCSIVGHGTRVSVLADFAGHAATRPAAAQSDTARLAYGFAAARIVVIDNDHNVLEAMRTLLDRWSCDVRYATDLREIDALAAREPGFRPEIILADYHLDHGESGLMAVERLRTVWGNELPAVIITADHAPTVADAAVRANCELLRKPVRPAELRALMQHLLS